MSVLRPSFWERLRYGSVGDVFWTLVAIALVAYLAYLLLTGTTDTRPF